MFLLEILESKMVLIGNARWQCLDCGYEAKRNHVRDHVEAKHLPPGDGYVCPHCFINLRNRIALRDHFRRSHKL